ncbi:DNA methyltransferase [Arthrobacter sp. PAMC25284]|uniref:class I SAM-dependent DNA methyltransferase n=1 Tax=Arthrobacter sp. PAMC25284 TaxID=2861279 RepID=UPI001C627A0A|nr:DNA methyltransferase [Arthrobacter sp. PAMC25284]QYF88554.1 N-6 DNA methylase [Arthrobacter sp. PAMC25284]
MHRTRNEIVESLKTFVASWSGYSGTERAGAQTFVNQLVQAYTGVEDPRTLDASHESHLPLDEGQRHGFIDFYWPEVVLVEMKGPKESVRLAEHRPQMLRYWKYCATDEVAAPPFTVLCSFDRFEVWEPGRFPNAPRDVFTLEQLPDFVDSLAFLMGRGRVPTYGGPGQKITVGASADMIGLFNRLYERFHDREEYGLKDDDLRRFIIQSTWTLFAEDLGLIPANRFANLLRDLSLDARGAKQRIPGREVQSFLAAMNSRNAIDRSEGFLEGLPYVNGGLLESVPYVPLNSFDLDLLVQAAKYDWRYVNPTIFGSLFEECLGDRRRQFGAHYTHEQDIMQIVEPTILKPWREKIDGTEDYKKLEALLKELCQFKVLDPACGSGNFLYVAYREIRRLEHYLKDRIDDLKHAKGKPVSMHLEFYPIENLYGIEIEPFAVQIARLTIWMGHAQMAREMNVQGDDPLPLHNLDTIIEADALKAEWPEVDAIIGNPPFIGYSRIREYNGADYLKFLESTFKAGIADLCVYWFRKANDHLKNGQRAGLVATNSITQNISRHAGLDYIFANGAVITDAVRSQDWSGEAAVDVSLVNWVKNPLAQPTSYVLDRREVAGINNFLQAGVGSRRALPLPGNRGVAFEGCKPAGDGFVLDNAEAHTLLLRTDADYGRVVRQYLVGRDIANSPNQEPSRWIIDFGMLELEDAMAYPAALSIVRERVKPVRDQNNRESRRERWWRFGEAVPAMRDAMEGSERYIAVGITGKRLLLSWADTSWCPSNLVVAIAREDDWTMGILSSSIHETWAREQSSTLEDRLRYTSKTALITFPLPDLASAQRDKIEQAARDIGTERTKACDKLVAQGKKQAGLTAVYNAMDEGAFTDLRAAHKRLDESVCRSYDWPTSVLDDRAEVVDRLYELNAKIAADLSGYTPFAQGESD